MTIRLGDADYAIGFTMREALEYERRTGRSFFADASAIGDNPTAEVLIGLLWCALLKHSPQLTLEELASTVTLADLPKIAEALREAYAVPFAAAGGEAAAPPASQ